MFYLLSLGHNNVSLICLLLFCPGDLRYGRSILVSDELDEDVSVESSLVSNSAKV